MQMEQRPNAFIHCSILRRAKVALYCLTLTLLVLSVNDNLTIESVLLLQALDQRNVLLLRILGLGAGVLDLLPGVVLGLALETDISGRVSILAVRTPLLPRRS